MDEPSKANQMIYVWESDPIIFYSDFADSNFHVIFFPRTRFCSLQVVYSVSENAALERSWSPQIQSCSCYCIRPLPLPSLLCYSLSEHGHTVRMCAKAHHGRCLLLLISTIFSSVCSGRSKNLKNCFNPLHYAYIFTYRQQIHWLL